MGSFSIWHWIIVLLFLAVPVFLVGGLVWLVVHLRRKPVPAPHAPSSVDAPSESHDVRLKTLEDLLEQGHIERDEYARQRAAIIAGI